MANQHAQPEGGSWNSRGYSRFVCLLGAVVTGEILRRRIGIRHERRIKVFDEGGVGIGWSAKSTMFTTLWPIIATVWLTRSFVR